MSTENMQKLTSSLKIRALMMVLINLKLDLENALQKILEEMSNNSYQYLQQNCKLQFVLIILMNLVCKVANQTIKMEVLPGKVLYFGSQVAAKMIQNV